MDEDTESSSSRGRPSKVARLVDQYDLAELGAEIETEWTKEGADRRSLRDLADYFNRELLRQILRNANVETLDGEVENFYRLLTTDSASVADRTRVRRRLEGEGIDVDQLESDFVSYQAIRTYLQKHRGVRYEATDGDPISQLQTAVEQLQNKLVAVTESRLERVNDGTVLEIENPRVMVGVQVACTECGRQMNITELSDGTSCDCV
ncbi:rod-determining factor RdfA [Natronorubrum sp. FCH18a]|uniref:rod-determining factor RdfA n=1 Tax=Natronorubrum sp. FCH18a TaxID=3447018 RepID=UPI003F51821C